MADPEPVDDINRFLDGRDSCAEKVQGESPSAVANKMRTAM